MRRIQSRYRAHSAFEQGNWNAEAITKICLLAFPSLWVSYITMFQTDWLREDTYSVLCQSAFLFVYSYSCSDSFCVLTCLSVCALQGVSAPLAWLDSFWVLTCPSCALQLVSAPHLVRFFLCPDLSICLCSPGSECPLLGQILSGS